MPIVIVDADSYGVPLAVAGKPVGPQAALRKSGQLARLPGISPQQ